MNIFHNDLDQIDDDNEQLPEIEGIPTVIEEDFQERGTTRQLAALYAALATARGQFTPIVKGREVVVKTRTGGEYKFSYADMDVMLQSTTPALAANGLAFLSPFTRVSSDVMTQRAILSHKDGARLIFVFKSMPPDGDDLKTLGGHQTYLMRYAYRSVLALAGGEDLDDMPQQQVREEQGATARDKARPNAPQNQQNAPKAPAQPARPTSQPAALPAASTHPAARAIEEMLVALRACGYTTKALAFPRIAHLLQGEVVENWKEPGVLSREQIDTIMAGLMAERGEQLKRQAEAAKGEAP